MSSLKPVYLEVRDLPDAWFSLVAKDMGWGEGVEERLVDEGSFKGQKRLEFDYISVHVAYPGSKPLIPDIPPHLGIPAPTSMEYVEEYLSYLMTEVRKGNEQYTYGERIVAAQTRCIAHIDREQTFFKEDIPETVNQMTEVINRYVQRGYGNNQLIMQVGQPGDIMLKDPPCLRHIDTRIKNGKLHFFIYFRSWDLWAGLPSNLAAIQMMKEYMASEIGVEDGEMIFASKGLHLYEYAWGLAGKRVGLSPDELEAIRNEWRKGKL